jgi:hypothetical protein
VSDAGSPGDGDAARTPIRVGRPRVVALAWLGVLVGTVGVALLGQPGPDQPTAPAPSASPGVGASDVARTSPSRDWPAIVHAAVTGRPKGEDGVMGGLPFGTAWLWLDSERADAGSD